MKKKPQSTSFVGLALLVMALALFIQGCNLSKAKREITALKTEIAMLKAR